MEYKLHNGSGGLCLLVSLMRRSSNNLNQLTRKVHETGRVYDADLEDISQRQEDVYKRQVYGCGQFLWYAAGENAKQPSVRRGAGPVSYTHLDVYKRQILQAGVRARS